MKKIEPTGGPRTNFYYVDPPLIWLITDFNGFEALNISVKNYRLFFKMMYFAPKPKSLDRYTVQEKYNDYVGQFKKINHFYDPTLGRHAHHTTNEQARFRTTLKCRFQSLLSEIGSRLRNGSCPKRVL